MKDEKLQKTIFIKEDQISNFFYLKFKDPQIEQKYNDYNSKWIIKLRKIISCLILFYSSSNCYFLYSRLGNNYILYSSLSYVVVDAVICAVLLYLNFKNMNKYVILINSVKFFLTLSYFFSVMVIYAYYSFCRENTKCDLVNEFYCSNFLESIIRNFYLQAILTGFKYFLFMKPSKFYSVMITLLYFIYFITITIMLNRSFLTYASELSSCVVGMIVSVVSSVDVQKFFRETFIYNQRVNTMFNYFKDFINDLNHQYVSLYNEDILIYNNAFYDNLAETISINTNKRENIELITQSNNSDITASVSYESVMSYFENFILNVNCNLTLKMAINNVFNCEGGKNKLKDTSNHFVKLGVFHNKSRGCILSVSYRYFFLSDCKGIFDIILEDITQIKSAEKIEIESKIKQKLLSKVAHEFKTPLLTIINMVQELRNDIESKDYRNIELISNQVCNVSQYVLFQINDIIYYSNQETMKFHIEEINILGIMKFCEGVLQALLANGTGNKKNIQVNFVYDKNICDLTILSDEYRLKQIVLNLISNAVKFTKYGEITMRADFIDEKYVSIKIIDTGIGLSNADIQKIKLGDDQPVSINMEESYNQMGTGLGLGIAQTMIKKLNHGFEITSELNCGSTFEIRIFEPSFKQKFKKSIESFVSETVMYKGYSSHFLFQLQNKILEYSSDDGYSYNEPLVILHNRKSSYFQDNTSFDIPPSKLHSRYSSSFNYSNHIKQARNQYHKSRHSKQLNNSYQRRMSILIVDDSVSIRSATANLIKKSNDLFKDFQVIIGNDGIETLSLVMHDQHEGGNIKIIISDENMEFMNGSESFRILKELEKMKKVRKIFLVCLTAFSDNLTLDSIKRLGADIVVGKPLTLNSLSNIYQEYIDFKAKYNLS